MPGSQPKGTSGGDIRVLRREFRIPEQVYASKPVRHMFGQIAANDNSVFQQLFPGDIRQIRVPKAGHIQ